MNEEVTMGMPITNQEQAIRFYKKAVDHLNSQGFLTVPGLIEQGGAFYPTINITEMTKTEYESHTKTIKEQKAIAEETMKLNKAITNK